MVALQVLPRHLNFLLDGPFWVFTQVLLNLYVIGVYEVETLEDGQRVVHPASGMPEPELTSKGWKNMYVWFEGQDPFTAVSAGTVMDALNSAFKLAEIDTM